MSKKLPAVPYLIWMVVFILLPLALVVYFALTDSSGNFTVANISAVAQYVPVILNSIWLAAISTAICLVIGYPLAYLISRMDGNHQRTMVMLIMLPMWMSFLLR
ncbi:MAG TPA: ABC transporter permease, partial [Firmicutes bacterium]|nr:ABC transporter permease [Bacillota bacterium]